jgi:hypothetical protein
MLELLADFATSGKLGPIQLEMAPRHVRDWLGEPWLEGPHKRFLIWNYGALEVTSLKGEIFDWEIGLIRISTTETTFGCPIVSRRSSRSPSSTSAPSSGRATSGSRRRSRQSPAKSGC